jgi:protein-glutamine gamma-glutamyltransferase
MMIQIPHVSLDSHTIEQEWPFGTLQRMIFERIAASSYAYRYSSFAVLKFEIQMRSNIIFAAKMLGTSGAKFTTFRKSKCHFRYWKRTRVGSFKLKESAEPAAAINDIFINGPKYAFECSTGAVVVYYKALLESVGPQTFNRLFPAIRISDGKYDEKLLLNSYEKTEYLPGDVQYFKNPEHHRKTPEWQGENSVVLENNLYFAHGIGVRTKEGMIEILNTKRKPNAKISAYLEDRVVRPDFAYLSQYEQHKYSENGIRPMVDNRFAIAQIGGVTYTYAL